MLAKRVSLLISPYLSTFRDTAQNRTPVADMLIAILGICTKEELDEADDDQEDVAPTEEELAERRRVIKSKSMLFFKPGLPLSPRILAHHNWFATIVSQFLPSAKCRAYLLS